MGFLYWDGQISQKTLKKNHVEKGEAIWKVVAGDTSTLTKQVQQCRVLQTLGTD